MWPEVEKAKSEKRCELVLSGKQINERLEKSGLDENIFNLTTLNYLNIGETIIEAIPDDISKLVNLQTLVLHHNKLTAINLNIFKLTKLKVLDLSRNSLKEIPGDIEHLSQLTTLNVSSNEIEDLPNFEKCVKLAALNSANNKLTTFPDVCYNELSVLADLLLNGNKIETIPGGISKLKALKNLDLSSNAVKILPGELSDCGKLKDLNLKENPIADRRLLKLIDQCRTKQIIDYVRQNCPKTEAQMGEGVKKNKKSSSSGGKQENVQDEDETTDKKYKITVRHASDDSLKVIVTDEVKTIRGFFLGCVVKDLQFNEETFKKFIQLQTKLHEGICQKRNLATIATHDLLKLSNIKSIVRVNPIQSILKASKEEEENPQKTLEENFNKTCTLTSKEGSDSKCPETSNDSKKALKVNIKEIPMEKNVLIYTAKPPKQLRIKPLNRQNNMTGAQLFSKLQIEADNLRKEKKRNVYSGIHKYLYLLEGQKMYPCLLAGESKEVISFPPITNSDTTKISEETKDIFIEVTSNMNQLSCKHIMDTILKEMVLLLDNDLLVEQVKNVDYEGNMKVVYPSRTDLVYDENVPIKIVRE